MTAWRARSVLDLMAEASAAGVDEVLARGELTRRLDGILRGE